ncbi:hypothetical protein JCM17844_00120 [Iodidimonas gelatinilytica]|uniref:EamA domain-containing protein n=1 Tax=Iodidimonas gelatinilytica TaxID=1236966 RepID=A0A5A7MMY5_9PROT|nr:DMT family transporter [Iodidimonas gelatinilytica]GEQ96375.1 hypothetical protein JCM17844_00120 [Iodidimonas gelatinilytica]
MRSSQPRVFFGTLVTLIAFAANSVLCRMALQQEALSPATFTGLRLLSGAVMLALLMGMRPQGWSQMRTHLSVSSACALLVYAAAFSYAYIVLDTGTGALIAFAAVQLSMIGGAVMAGARLSKQEWLGAVIAMGGLTWFLLPGATAPNPFGAVLMGISGLAWGVYSLKGGKSRNPLAATAGNFIVATVIALPVLFLLGDMGDISTNGAGLAIASGAITSGLGYAIWYAVLPLMRPHIAAISQLSVPLIATLGGVLFVGETISLRFAIASLIVLGGLMLVVINRKQEKRA